MLCCQLKCSICQTKYHERNGLFQSSYWHTLCIVCKLNFPQVLLNVHTHITFVHNNPMQKLMLKGRLQGFYFICFEKFYISIFRIFLSPLWSTIYGIWRDLICFHWKYQFDPTQKVWICVITCYVCKFLFQSQNSDLITGMALWNEHTLLSMGSWGLWATLRQYFEAN